MHFYPHNIGDFALVTAGLDLEEIGIFVRLLDRYYATEKPIKFQWVDLSFKGEANEKAFTILNALFEEIEPGCWIYEPAQKVIQEYQKNAEKNRENGKKGGRPRKDADIENPSKPTGLISQTQNNPDETQPINKNQQTNNQEQTNRKQEPEEPNFRPNDNASLETKDSVYGMVHHLTQDITARRYGLPVTAASFNNSQLRYLADRLVNWNSFITAQRHPDETKEAFYERVCERLKDEEYFNYCRPYLVKLGCI